MSDEQDFVGKRIECLWAKLIRPGLTSDETFGLLWELNLLRSNPTGCTEPVHEVVGIFQPDFDAIRRQKFQLDRKLYGIDHDPAP